MPISAADVEALALANPIDVDAASERYMPAVVVQFFTAIEARTVPADQHAESRANPGERLEALVATAFAAAEAAALGGEFAQWTGVTRVDDEWVNTPHYLFFISQGTPLIKKVFNIRLCLSETATYRSPSTMNYRRLKDLIAESESSSSELNLRADLMALATAACALQAAHGDAGGNNHALNNFVIDIKNHTTGVLACVFKDKLGIVDVDTTHALHTQLNAWKAQAQVVSNKLDFVIADQVATLVCFSFSTANSPITLVVEF